MAGKPVKTAPALERPKKAPLAYQGTMKVKQEVTYKGTANLGSSNARKDTYGNDRDRYRRREPSYDEEDEDEDDYGGYSSSDMEADTFELDNEEREAERMARKEDLLAQREEEEARRRKALKLGRRI